MKYELTPSRLNLTPGTHVHLVEPQYNPMVEAQAATRVDRLDQQKDVVIQRYIVEKSIEKVGLLTTIIAVMRLNFDKDS